LGDVSNEWLKAVQEPGIQNLTISWDLWGMWFVINDSSLTAVKPSQLMNRNVVLPPVLIPPTGVLDIEQTPGQVTHQYNVNYPNSPSYFPRGPQDSESQRQAGNQPNMNYPSYFPADPQDGQH
jgi:hypothetical protein